LHLAAINALRPQVLQLHEALQEGKPGRSSRWGALKNGSGDISGALAVKVMSRVRTIIDETLKSDYTPFVAKDVRKVLRSESKLLRTYSDKETLKKFSDYSVHPTVEQRNAFRERQLEIVDEEVLERKDRKADKSDEAEVPSSSESAKKETEV
jgi:hypothetical protein